MKRFSWEESTSNNRPAESQTLHIRKTRQARPFLEHGGRTRSNEYKHFRNLSTSLVPFRQASPSWQNPPSSPEAVARPYEDVMPPPQAEVFAPRLVMPPAQRPCVLCPHVSVTTEVTALMDGQKSLWAAIEVSGKLSKLPAAPGTYPHGNMGIVTGSFIEHELGERNRVSVKSKTDEIIDRFFEFGCLYDLNIDILPCQGSSVAQVLGEQKFPT